MPCISPCKFPCHHHSLRRKYIFCKPFCLVYIGEKACLNNLNIRYLSKYDAEFLELNSSTDESDSEVESEEEDFDLGGDDSPEHDEGEEQQSEEEAANMP